MARLILPLMLAMMALILSAPVPANWASPALPSYKPATSSRMSESQDPYEDLLEGIIPTASTAAIAKRVTAEEFESKYNQQKCKGKRILHYVTASETDPDVLPSRWTDFKSIPDFGYNILEMQIGDFNPVPSEEMLNELGVSTEPADWHCLFIRQERPFTVGGKEYKASDASNTYQTSYHHPS
jgi:hypothetical protein